MRTWPEVTVEIRKVKRKYCQSRKEWGEHKGAQEYIIDLKRKIVEEELIQQREGHIHKKELGL